MSEAEKQKIVVQISAVQTELQRTIDERWVGQFCLTFWPLLPSFWPLLPGILASFAWHFGHFCLAFWPLLPGILASFAWYFGLFGLVFWAALPGFWACACTYISMP